MEFSSFRAWHPASMYFLGAEQQTPQRGHLKFSFLAIFCCFPLYSMHHDCQSLFASLFLVSSTGWELRTGDMISVLYFLCLTQHLAYIRHSNTGWMAAGCTTCNLRFTQSFGACFDWLVIDSLYLLQKAGPSKWWRGSNANWGTA